MAHRPKRGAGTRGNTRSTSARGIPTRSSINAARGIRRGRLLPPGERGQQHFLHQALIRFVLLDCQFGLIWTNAVPRQEMRHIRFIPVEHSIVLSTSRTPCVRTNVPLRT